MRLGAGGCSSRVVTGEGGCRGGGGRGAGGGGGGGQIPDRPPTTLSARLPPAESGKRGGTVCFFVKNTSLASCMIQLHSFQLYLIHVHSCVPSHPF